MIDTETITVKEFAKLFRVHECTIRKCVKNRQIYAARIGGQLRIPTTELKRLLTGNAATAPMAVA